VAYFCPSCQAKRSALFAEHVITEILEPVPHRRRFLGDLIYASTARRVRHTVEVPALLVRA
jgi:hypothetical protein